MKGIIFSFYFLLFSIAQAQTRLIPSWQSGDTLEYFISESELVETERVSLESYSVQLIIKEKNTNFSVFEVHLKLSKTKQMGDFWQRFYHYLQDVPFTYSFKYGEEINFLEVQNLAQTVVQIDKVLLLMASKENLQPFDYNELTRWLNDLKPKGNLPVVFVKYLNPLNQVLSVYGDQPLKKSKSKKIIHGCNDSSVVLNFLTENRLEKGFRDTLIIRRIFELDTTISRQDIQLLANCKKLEGLGVVVQIDNYHLVQIEVFRLQLGRVYSYQYDCVINMQFEDYSTSRTNLLRVVLVE